MSEENTWSTTQRNRIKEQIEIESNKDKDDNGNHRMYPVELYDDSSLVDMAVYNIDIDLVKFNKINGRLAKFIAHHCKKNNIDGFDETKEEHQDIIQSILLNAKNYGQEKVADLEVNLLKAGQKYPALITTSGVLWNGNRRCAVMKKIFDNLPSSGIAPLVKGRIKVCVLPENFDPKQLRALEKRLQQTPETKQAYGQVNEMVRIQETINKHIENGMDLDNPSDEQKKEIGEEAETDYFDDWKRMIAGKRMVDLMDDWLVSRNDTHTKELIGNYAIIEDAKATTFFEATRDLLYTRVIPFFTNNSSLGDPDEMFDAFKAKCFLAFDDLLDKNEGEVYKAIIKLKDTFKKASGDITSTDPGDTTGLVISIMENSPIISNWDEHMSKEPEELAALGKESITVGGVTSTISELENEGFQKNVTKLKKVGESPNKIIRDINELLVEILAKPSRVGPQDLQLKELITDCIEKLQEIENINNQ